MSITLAPDDMKVGMYVTVLSVKQNGQQQVSVDLFGNIINASPLTHPCIGSVLKVKGVDLPFLNCCRTNHPNENIIFDIRMFNFKALSMKFVKSLTPSLSNLKKDNLAFPGNF